MSSPYGFEVAIGFGLTAVGTVLCPQFEEHTPKGRRVPEPFLVSAVAVAGSATAGWSWFFALLGALGAVAGFVHGWWLPRVHGIHGWTTEPREKYYALRGWKQTPGGAGRRRPA